MTISTADLFTALPALANVHERAVAQLARASTVRRYARGATLYRSGDAADGLYLVLAGKVLVVRETPSKSQMLHTESAGGVLGEIPVFGGGRFPATARAIEPTRCAHLAVGVIERLLREEPSFARFALRRVAARAQSLLHRIDDLTTTTVTSRLAAFIVARAADNKTPDFSLGATQLELAEELGTAREVIVRGLAALIAAGAIARSGRARFAVRRPAILESIAGM